MFIFLTRLGRLFVGVTAVIAITTIFGFGALTTVPMASHQPGGGNSTSSLALVLVNSTDGVPHWGQTVTFHVSTTATSQPNVSLNCSQNGTLVYSAVSGFYASYPWPGTQNFVLSSPSWTSGAASCTAKLYYFGGKKTVTLTTLNFAVQA